QNLLALQIWPGNLGRFLKIFCRVALIRSRDGHVMRCLQRNMSACLTFYCSTYSSFPFVSHLYPFRPCVLPCVLLAFRPCFFAETLADFLAYSSGFTASYCTFCAVCLPRLFDVSDRAAASCPALLSTTPGPGFAALCPSVISHGVSDRGCGYSSGAVQ